MSRPEHFINQAITAIKQARALDKKAENARELGLDYEPADGTQVSKVWWDGEKLMAKPIPLEDIYQPVQEPVACECNQGQVCHVCDPIIPSKQSAQQEPAFWYYTLVVEGQVVGENFTTVNWDTRVEPFGRYDIDHGGKVTKQPLYTTPPAQPAPVQPVAWQPIASAPKDGTRILCQNEKGLVNICEWTQCSATGDRFTSSDDRTFGSGPAYTSWMPLPQPIESTPPAQPAPVQPVAWGFHIQFNNGKDATFKGFEHLAGCEAHLESGETITMIYTTPPAAQPAVPDALNPKDENPAYAAGWNDCRAAMMEMLK